MCLASIFIQKSRKSRILNHWTLVRELRNPVQFLSLTVTCCATFSKLDNLEESKFVICKANRDLLVKNGTCEWMNAVCFRKGALILSDNKTTWVSVLLLCGPVPAPKLRDPRALRFQRAISTYRCLFKSLVELQYFNDIVGFWQGVLELIDL